MGDPLADALPRALVLHGDITPAALGEEGVYHEATRFLSCLILELGKGHPFILSSTVRDDNALLAVVGDVNVEEAFAAVTRVFGPWQPHEPPAVPPAEVPETRLPTADELELIREVIDPDGAREREVPDPG